MFGGALQKPGVRGGDIVQYVAMDDFSEMIIEFRGPRGDLFCSGRAGSVWGVRSGERVNFSDLLWRNLEGWEEEMWLLQAASLPPLRRDSGPPMKGEGGTVLAWEEGDPYWMIAESEEEDVIETLLSWPPALMISLCEREDCRTARFCFPAALLEIRRS